jgi:hypothetical protein
MPGMPALEYLLTSGVNYSLRSRSRPQHQYALFLAAIDAAGRSAQRLGMVGYLQVNFHVSLHQMVQAIVTVLAVINPVVCGSILLMLTPFRQRKDGWRPSK